MQNKVDTHFIKRKSGCQSHDFTINARFKNMYKNYYFIFKGKIDLLSIIIQSLQYTLFL